MQPLAPPAAQVHRILGGQAVGARKPRQDTEAGPAGPRLDHPVAVIEKAGIAAELVDQEATDHGRVTRVDHGLRADDLGDHAAPVDIARQHDRHAGGAGESHIGDVTGAQVHLGRAARPLDDDKIVRGGQAGEAVQHTPQQAGLQRLIIARLGPGNGTALKDHLRAAIGLGLQQDGVHVGLRLDPSGQRLKGLGAPDLGPVGGDGCVVRHVLRLEGRDLDAPPSGCAAEPRHQERLADIRAGALDHQCRHVTPRQSGDSLACHHPDR